MEFVLISSVAAFQLHPDPLYSHCSMAIAFYGIRCTAIAELQLHSMPSVVQPLHHCSYILCHPLYSHCSIAVTFYAIRCIAIAAWQLHSMPSVIQPLQH